MASKNSITCRLTGTPELEARLRTLEVRVRKSVVQKALKKAAEPIISSAMLKAMVTQARGGERLGGLSKSIGAVVRSYTRKVVCVIGPLHGRVYQRQGKTEVPAKIAHLVEFGHRIAIGGALRKEGRRLKAGQKYGRASGQVRGYPFLRPAWDTQRFMAQYELEKELKAGIEEAASR